MEGSERGSYRLIGRGNSKCTAPEVEQQGVWQELSEQWGSAGGVAGASTRRAQGPGEEFGPYRKDNGEQFEGSRAEK